MFRTEVSVKDGFPDPEGDKLEKDIRDIGITPEKWTRISDVDLLEGELEEAEVTKIGRELLADSVLEYFS